MEPTRQEEAKPKRPQPIFRCVEISCEDWDEFVEALKHANNRALRFFPEDARWRMSDIVVEM